MSTTNNTKIIRSQAEREENRRLFRALQEKGLSPRVVTDGTKACHSHNWQVPDAQQATATLDAWAYQAGDAGIALLLGAPISDGSHLGVIDVDNDAYTRAVACLLGNPAVVKIGKKGASFFVRVAGTPGGSFTRNPEFRNRAIVNGIETDKVKVVECLFDGKISVLPPSIHPDTGKPYIWTGPTIEEADLLQLAAVSFDHDGPGLSLHLLKAVVTNKHFMQLASGVSTHDAARDFSAALVALEPSDERIEDIVKAVLPEGYSGNTLKELPGLIKGAREKGLDRRKSKKAADGTAADKVLELFRESGAKLFHCKNKEAYVSIPLNSGGYSNVPVRSERLTDFLHELYYVAYDEKSLSPHEIDKAVQNLVVRAKFGSPQFPIAMRVGGDLEHVYIDLGDDEGRVVEIDATGYRIVFDSPVKLVRRGQVQPLPIPIPTSAEESALASLGKLLGQEFSVMQRFIGFLISALHPKGPFFNLMVEGPKGSGKSIICDAAKDIIDPFYPKRTSPPENEHELSVIASIQYMINIENESFISNQMSDAYCRLNTGGGFLKRKLYTDDGLKIFDNKAPFVINGIRGFATRGDLLDRSITIRLEPIEKRGSRDTESAIAERFQKLYPFVLHEIYTAVSHSIANLAATPLPTEIRNIDAAQWVQAAEGYLGWEPGSFVTNLADTQRAAQVEVTDMSSVTTRLIEFLDGKTREAPYTGLYSQFYEKLIATRQGRFDSFPKSASALSGWVTRAQGLKEIGIHIEEWSSKRGSHVTAWLDSELHSLASKKGII